MNKKFSTLLASFLLAGGMTTANATVITDADVVAGGQYYYLEQVAELTGTIWAETFKANEQSGENFVIAYDYDLKQCVLTARKDGNYANYWRVVERAINGVKYYQLINAEGQLFSVKLGDKTISAFDIPSVKFTLNNGEEADVNGLSFTIEGKTYYLTAGDKLAEGVFAIKAIDTADDARGFDFTYAPGTAYTAKDLNAINGVDAGFNLSIGYINSSNKFAVYSDLQGNEFSGTLKASTDAIKTDKTNVDYSSTTAKVSDDSYFLTSGNKYLVLLNETWSKFNVTAGFGLGNKFALMDKEALLLQLAKDNNESDAAKKAIKAFRYTISDNVNDNPYIEVLVVDADNKAVGELYVVDFEGTQYLTINTSDVNADAQYNTAAGKTYVKLGSDSLVDWTKVATEKAYYTIVLAEDFEDTNDNLYEEGMVYGTRGCGIDVAAALLSPTEVQVNMPEGMWAFQYNNGTPKFVNRESGVEINASKVAVYDLGNNIYQGEDGAKYVITAHAIADLAEGYGVFTTEDTEYNLGIYSPVWKGVAYFAENHADSHKVGLDTDVENASVWTLAAETTARTNNTVNGTVKTATDSIYVINTVSYYGVPAGKTYKTWINVKDTMAVLSYTLKNAYGEYFAGEACTTGKMSVVFKKVGDYYNLIQVTKGKVTESRYHATFNPFKLYGGDSATDGLVAWTCMYERIENDLVAVEALAAPTYRRLVNEIDTISIYRDENSSQLLYEEGALLSEENANGEIEVLAGFLGLKNAKQFEIAPAMVAELVPSKDNMPMYLLSVGTTVVPNGKWCSIHETADCEHATETEGYVEGRYLVCLSDSAKAWKEDNKHATNVLNPYTNEEGNIRFGFVQATHRNDSLVWANSTIEDKTGIEYGDKKMKEGLVAFKYVDEAEGSFKIQTCEGFLKWMNGVVVATSEANADVFNMNEEETSAPTANEAISAAAVTVVAGEGNVTIAGAAGKKVVIANILGQTIANTVLTSDNATIAAPAGVVVVAVEGEAAVKAIVK